MAKHFTFLTIEKADSVLRMICKTYKKKKSQGYVNKTETNEYVTWKYLFKHVYLNPNKSANKKKETTFTIFVFF